MVNKVIKIIVAIVVGAILWYALKLLLVAIHAPPIIATFAIVLGCCLIAWFIWHEFGSGGGAGPP